MKQRKGPRIKALGHRSQKGVWRSEFLAELMAAQNKAGFLGRRENRQCVVN